MGRITCNPRLNMLFASNIEKVEELLNSRIETAFHNVDPSLAVVRLSNIPRNENGKAIIRQKLNLLLPLLSKGPFLLIEKETGPWLAGPDLKQGAFVSVTYAGGSAWVAICDACPVGIDAVFLTDCAGWESVAETYFDEAMVKEIGEAAQPLNAFALEWATFEARLKCLGRSLSENPAPIPPLKTYSVLTKETALAVALDNQGPRGNH